MPEQRFKVQWPDGENTTYYSPSTIVKRYLQEEASLPLDVFLQRVLLALDMASERVKERYGYSCSSAAAEQQKIQQKAQQLQALEIDGRVVVTFESETL